MTVGELVSLLQDIENQDFRVMVWDDESGELADLEFVDVLGGSFVALQVC